ncbi:MAG: LPS export ABC transporter periplasmic protein LptC [Methylophaga sp.]|nr:LPS export ABC transporter periplasmic protein LptC [Methylophaga sp.]
MNAIFNLPWLLRLLLIAAVLLTLWLLFTNQHAPESQQQGDALVERSSDYGMTDFTMTVMNLDGQPQRIIKGSEASHYPKGDRTEIINPDALHIAIDDDDWILQADRADTSGKAEHIVLTGNVIITNKDQPDIQLLTELLHLDTVNNTAYTDRPVLMRSPNGDTHSVGFHAALQEETINLHSRVRGQYDAPAAN